MHTAIHNLRQLVHLVFFSGLILFCSCGEPEKAKPAPPVSFEEYLQRFNDTVNLKKNYELGVNVYDMLRGMNDTLLLRYLQPIRSKALLQGRDTICNAPFSILNPMPVTPSSVAYLQYSSYYGFGAILAKNSKYTATEIFWGGNHRSYIITYDPKGKIIDAMLCVWDQFFNDDSSHYSRKSVLKPGGVIEISQEGFSRATGDFSFKAFCHIAPNGRFELDSLRSPLVPSPVIFGNITNPAVQLADDYNSLNLKIRLDKTWLSYTLDADPTLLQKATIDTMQLDGKGLPEVIVREERYTMQSYGPVMGGWVTYYHQSFVWSIDERRELFKAINHYGRTDLNGDPEAGEFCEYDLSITKEGITIGEPKIKNRKSDHPPGKYVLKNGTYVVQ
ncbi:MAG: hypothetical protein FD123_4063 [Bacteroidetes bacterium]|nr:MAG: hypothetical protein FD123_4063 [Bacteroidota bacterium]